MANVLDALVGPTPVEEFLRDFWPERVFHAHGPLSRLPTIFSSPELKTFRTLASQYQGWLGFGRGSESGRMMSVQQINPLHLYELGLSVYLPDISESVPGADAFLRQLEKDLGIAAGCCGITVWASPQTDGAPTHFDGEDVFSIQLAGTKKFEVAPMTEYAFPYGPQFGPGARTFDDMYPQVEKDGFPDPAQAAWTTVNMAPGSVLFVPRGTWHRTTAEQDSFAISLGIRPPSVMDAYLEQFRRLLLQDPEWRRPLYGAYGNAQQREAAIARAQELIEKLPELVDLLPATDLAPPLLIDQLKNIDRSMRFQRELYTRIDFEPGQGLETLRIKAWSFDVSEHEIMKMSIVPQLSPVFRWLAESKVAFTAGELADRFPAVPFEQLQKLLEVLTQIQFLRLLSFPRLPASLMGRPAGTETLTQTAPQSIFCALNDCKEGSDHTRAND